MGAGVGGLVEADEPGLDILLDVSPEWGGPVRQRRVVVTSDIKFVKIFQQKRPL